MHLFISAGEPSGDLHGANLIRELIAKNPSARIVGFGGDKMHAAGADILFPLTQIAVMWFGRVLAHLPTFLRLARQAETYFAKERPDAVILIDYPGFHWHLAKHAKAAGIPVFYFVPPQLWAWGSWRVKKMQRTVDTVLTALPFEDDWYKARGVTTHYIGHPYFDELPGQHLDANFLALYRDDAQPVVGILPGSRNQEVSGNFPLMLAAARKIHAERPDVRFLVAAFNETQAAVAREQLAGANLPAEVHVKRTPEIIELATACLAVSGSVGLELLYRTTPTVVVYKLAKLALPVARFFMKCEHISLVNLLADERLYPEFLTTGDESAAMADHILGWLNRPDERDALVEKLGALKARYAIPGATARAATFIAGRVGGVRRAA